MSMFFRWANISEQTVKFCSLPFSFLLTKNPVIAFFEQKYWDNLNHSSSVYQKLERSCSLSGGVVCWHHISEASKDFTFACQTLLTFILFAKVSSPHAETVAHCIWIICSLTMPQNFSASGYINIFAHRKQSPDFWWAKSFRKWAKFTACSPLFAHFFVCSPRFVHRKPTLPVNSWLKANQGLELSKILMSKFWLKQLSNVIG